jgi:predicted nucleotidyltransferase
LLLEGFGAWTTVLAGSVSRGVADEVSDIEMLLITTPSGGQPGGVAIVRISRSRPGVLVVLR